MRSVSARCRTVGPRTPSFGIVKPVSPSLAPQAGVSAAVTHQLRSSACGTEIRFRILKRIRGFGPTGNRPMRRRAVSNQHDWLGNTGILSGGFYALDLFLLSSVS